MAKARRAKSTSRTSTSRTNSRSTTRTRKKKNNIDKNLVLIELGVGFNTPSIIRFPFEQLAYQYDNVILVRVNDKYNDMAFELKDRAICIKEDCAVAISKILN